MKGVLFLVYVNVPCTTSNCTFMRHLFKRFGISIRFGYFSRLRLHVTADVPQKS